MIASAKRRPPGRVDLVLVGAGNRGGDVYGRYVLEHDQQARIVAVAEPSPVRRERVAVAHGIPADYRFESWEELFSRNRLADGALVCSREQDHEGPTVAALEQGYDVLVEKALAPTLDGCLSIASAAQSAPGRLQVAHVLRHAPFFRKLHEVLEAGRVGEIVNVEHRENLAYFHMAHSYVRGNWGRSDVAGPMILTKCCHDFDILYWNLGLECLRIASIGSQYEFVPERVDAAVPERCTDGCPIESKCLYSAIGTYLEFRPFPTLRAQLNGRRPEEVDAPAQWPFIIVAPDGSYASRRRALESGPYGRCVYRCGNDTPENQIVTMEFAGGVTAALTMQGHSHEEQRSMRYDGTKATLRGIFGPHTELVIHEHGKAQPERIPVEETYSLGHGGGDDQIMRSFIRVIRGEEQPQTPASDAFESHLLAFAAEEARHTGTVVDVRAFRAGLAGSATA